MLKRTPILGLVVVGSFAGGFASRSWQDATPWIHAHPQAPNTLPEPTRFDDLSGTPRIDRFDEVIRKVAPAVVTVDAVKAVPESTSLRGKPMEESGSGVLIRFPGIDGSYVVTNDHVIKGSKLSDITAILADGRIMLPERMWSDPESDIAILKLNVSNLPALELADSDRVRIGQWVLAFGSPFGLSQTVTHGIISARDRGQISLGATIRIKEFLQTDAPINPGNSGGPLVDLNGQVIGINTAIATHNGSNSGISFSIPSNLLRRVGRELLEKGTVSRGYLGLQLAPTLEPQTALRLGLTSVRGAMVEGVHPEGPASSGGIRAGDIILKLDSVEVRDENHLINMISSLPVNQRIRLSVWRGRQVQEFDVVIGDWNRK